jgi:hypothetical protein
MPKISRLSARWRVFSLDIPFYRTGRLLARILSEDADNSHFVILTSFRLTAKIHLLTEMGQTDGMRLIGDNHNFRLTTIRIPA